MGKDYGRGAPAKAARQAYRDQYDQQNKQILASMPEWIKQSAEVVDCIGRPSHVDMKSFCGTERELRHIIEHLYANDGRDFDPTKLYPPSMLSSYGKEYALNAQGIYYRDSFSEDLVVSTRKVWVPSLSKANSPKPEVPDRQKRAQTFANHSRNNERSCKSEYAWDADAWSDAFGELRDDPCLMLDKREYTTLLPDSDPVTCRLTGTSTLVSRTPDITFGLATFSDKDAWLPIWATELQLSRLEKLMLHPKYGLISDPKRQTSELTFPFMVYEAKGWGGDCRVARRQACVAAAVYLDMLDDLARQPGQIGSPRPYQTKTSHHYQVFVLTSFGAYWHVLVGYRRPRQSTEHAGAEGMSETAYIFQKIWSGYVTHHQDAMELLSIIDQIHLWAITEHRTFVLEHLRAWHQLCDSNYLLEWDSKYDVPDHKKRKRSSDETEDLLVPGWVADMQESSRRDFQIRARLSLRDAIQQANLIKGKSPCDEEAEEAGTSWTCIMDGCTDTTSSDAAYLDHLRREHDYDDCELAKMRYMKQEDETDAQIRDRQRQGVMATGYRWPGFLWPGHVKLYPFQEHAVDLGEVFFNRPAKRPKTSKIAGLDPS